MDFELSPEQRAVQGVFRAFAAGEVRPRAAALDTTAEFPHDLFRRVGELGLFGMRYPEPEGNGAGVLAFVLVMEELAWASLALAASCAMQALMGTWFVYHHAPAAVRARLIGPALRGERIGAICLTEPDAGSDLAAVTTRAVAGDGGYALSGTKTWITSAPVADFFTVLARTSQQGLSFFLVERGAPGLTVGRAIDKAGVRASPTSEVSLAATPATCLLGELEQGMIYLRAILAEIRVMTAALAVGVARAALEDAVAYAAERQQFGQPINRFQAVQAHLADMAVDVEAARRMTYWAAWRGEQGLPNADQAAMAKLFASEAALRVCDRAARVLGSYGYAREFAVERYLRDVRFTLLGGGTSEILRLHIAKGLRP